MPELPEVETTIRGLRKKIVGRKIQSVWTNTPNIIRKGSFKKFEKNIKNLKILDIKRRAKNILIYLSNNYLLLIHQKMTGHLLYGKWRIEKNEPISILSGSFNERENQYIRLLFFFDNNWQLALSDMRKFAKVILDKKEKIENSKELKELGPEPLEKNFDFKKFQSILKNKKGRIKTILMNPKIISGIGNIYSDEILWESKVNPFKKINELNEKELKKIFLSIKNILKKAIELKGTSISDYRDVEGEKGYYSEKRKVYQREKEKCFRCKSIIERKKINNRSAHFCPVCQKL
jgi:formamidopyrimidine-DNA glycosylase